MRLISQYKKMTVAFATLISLFVLVFGSHIALAATPGQIRDVAGEFICNCGCNKMLDVCDMSCGKNLRKKIAEKIDAGLDKKKIMNYMENNFGQQILAAPKKEGFHLTAWLTPFALGAMGLGLVYWVIFSWAKIGRKNEAALASMNSDSKKRTKKEIEEDEKYQKTLDEELDKIDW